MEIKKEIKIERTIVISDKNSKLCGGELSGNASIINRCPFLIYAYDMFCNLFYKSLHPEQIDEPYRCDECIKKFGNKRKEEILKNENNIRSS